MVFTICLFVFVYLISKHIHLECGAEKVGTSEVVGRGMALEATWAQPPHRLPVRILTFCWTFKFSFLKV
jgi:hypothetical protein